MRERMGPAGREMYVSHYAVAGCIRVWTGRAVEVHNVPDPGLCAGEGSRKGGTPVVPPVLSMTSRVMHPAMFYFDELTLHIQVPVAIYGGSWRARQCSSPVRTARGVVVKVTVGLGATAGTPAAVGVSPEISGRGRGARSGTDLADAAIPAPVLSISAVSGLHGGGRIARYQIA